MPLDWRTNNSQIVNEQHNPFFSFVLTRGMPTWKLFVDIESGTFMLSHTPHMSLVLLVLARSCGVRACALSDYYFRLREIREMRMGMAQIVKKSTHGYYIYGMVVRKMGVSWYTNIWQEHPTAHNNHKDNNKHKNKNVSDVNCVSWICCRPRAHHWTTDNDNRMCACVCSDIELRNFSTSVLSI